MTYANRGDKVILYAGNLPSSELERLGDALNSEGVTLLAVVGPPSNISPAYAGPPSTLLVIEPPEDDEPETIDGDVIKSCPGFGPHQEHRWLSVDSYTYICPGVSSLFAAWRSRP